MTQKPPTSRFYTTVVPGTAANDHPPAAKKPKAFKTDDDGSTPIDINNLPQIWSREE
ncbi:MAG: hypothetical protein ACAH83_02725 [Alphaproteobacteria bacterium]